MAHKPRPSLRQLEYLVAVADTLSFHRAAERCAVSQPGLSSQILKLEQQLGVQAFERDRRRVHVTEAGQALVEQARAILFRVDELVERARSGRDPLAGELRLGVIPTVSPYVLPKVLPAVRRRYPQLRLLIHEDQTSRLVLALDAGDLDLLLLALEADLGNAETLTLFEEPFLFAMPSGHRLQDRKRIKPEDLAHEEVLVLEDGHCLRDSVLEVCDRSGARELADFRASSLGTLVQMVASGVGVTLLPAMAAAVESRAARTLRVRPFQNPQPFRRIGLAFRPSSPRKEAFLRLGELFEARLEAH